MNLNQAPDLEVYTREQACRVAGLGRTKFYHLERSGRIKVRQIDGKGVVLRADLLAFLNSLPTSLEVGPVKKRSRAKPEAEQAAA